MRFVPLFAPRSELFRAHRRPVAQSARVSVTFISNATAAAAAGTIKRKPSDRIIQRLYCRRVYCFIHRCRLWETDAILLFRESFGSTTVKRRRRNDEIKQQPGYIQSVPRGQLTKIFVRRRVKC